VAKSEPPARAPVTVANTPPNDGRSTLVVCIIVSVFVGGVALLWRVIRTWRG